MAPHTHSLVGKLGLHAQILNDFIDECIGFDWEFPIG
jgi:hypothetical protein